MLSITAHGARDLRLDERPDPAAPGPGEVAVEMRAGGVCGSDLHYYHHGGFGTVRIREPMILGHEAAGVVSGLGEGVAGLEIGQTVAIDPSRPCRVCSYCRRGREALCRDMRFRGSAMRLPHVQGLFRERLVVPAEQAVPVAASPALAALCEPFAVCLHAAARAGSLVGARVLVTGSGPIGCLAVAAARLSGAAEIVATDLAAAPLKIARALGADRALNLSEGEGPGEGYDVAFECSGASPALAGALEALGPGGRLVLVGIGGELSVPASALIPREIDIRASFRFDREFELAARLISERRVDLSPLVTHTLPLREAEEAFRIASDRAQAMKVQIALGG